MDASEIDRMSGSDKLDGAFHFFRQITPLIMAAVDRRYVFGERVLRARGLCNMHAHACSS